MLWSGILFFSIAMAAAYSWRIRQATRAYPPTGEFVRVDACNYHFVSKGTGPCVVLWHGTGGSLEDYPASILDALSNEFRVIAVDRPGHGHSDRPADANTPLAQARILRRVFQALGCERAIMVGHSWSGAAVLAYALEYPSDTAGVVLLQGTVYRQPSTVTPVIRALALPVLGPLLAGTMIPLFGAPAIQRTLARAYHPDPIPPEYLRRAQVMWTRPRQARALALDSVGRDESIDALSRRYSELHVPIVLVVGASDGFIDPAGQSLRFREEHGDARVCMIPEVGHQVPMLRPLAVIEAVRLLAATIPPSHA